MKNKKAQFQMSFGMIFSIILIVAFIGVAFYVIKVFLGLRDCSQIGNFYQSVQESAESAFRSPETSDDVTMTMPSKVEYVCIIDVDATSRGPMSNLYDQLSLVNKNLVVYPKTTCSGLGGIDITKIDIASITSKENPYCFKVEKGKVTVRVVKGLYDNSVKITR